MTTLPRHPDPNTSAGLWRILRRIAIIALIILAFIRLRAIITTIFIAAIFAYMLDPLVEWLTRRRWFRAANQALLDACNIEVPVFAGRAPQKPTPRNRPTVSRHTIRVTATLIVFIFSGAATWEAGNLVVSPFVSQIKQATSVEGRKAFSAQANTVIQNYNAQAPEWASTNKVAALVAKSDLVRTAERRAGEMGQQVLDGLKNIVEVVLLPVLAFYLLIDGRKIKHEFAALLPRDSVCEVIRIVNEFNRIMRAFVVAQFILCALAGVVVGVGLALLNVQYAFVLGVLAGVTRAIPIIGPILGGIPIILITLITTGPAAALGVLIFFTILHFVESKFVMPMLIGDRMDLHPVIIIVVLLVGQEMGGVIIGGQIGALLGMFFAAPLAAIARVMIRRYWLNLNSHTRRISHGHA